MADEEETKEEETSEDLAAGEDGEEAKEEKPAPVVVEETWEKPKRNVLLITIVMVNSVLVIGLFMRQMKLVDKLNEYKNKHFIITEPRTINEIPAPMRFELKPMSINLAEWKGPRRYLRLTPYLEIESKNTDEIEAKRNFLRDAIIKHVNQKNPEDLLSNGGADKLKAELIEALNQVMSVTKVTRIYFLDYRVN